MTGWSAGEGWPGLRVMHGLMMAILMSHLSARIFGPDMTRPGQMSQRAKRSAPTRRAGRSAFIRRRRCCSMPKKKDKISRREMPKPKSRAVLPLKPPLGSPTRRVRRVVRRGVTRRRAPRAAAADAEEPAEYRRTPKTAKEGKKIASKRHGGW